MTTYSTVNPAEAAERDKYILKDQLMKEIRALKDQLYNLTVRVTKQENDLQSQAQELTELKLKVRNTVDDSSSSDSSTTDPVPITAKGPETIVKPPGAATTHQSKIPLLNPTY